MNSKSEKTLRELIDEIHDSNFKYSIIPRRALLAVGEVVTGVNPIIDDADLVFYTPRHDDKIPGEYHLFFETLALHLDKMEKYHRGEVMSAVLVIELLVSQIFFVVINKEEVSKGECPYQHIKFFDSYFNSMWDKIDRNLDFGTKAKILEEIGTIDRKEAKIYPIMNVRNQVAHTLNRNFIYLDEQKKDKLLYSNLNTFQGWLNESFKYLVSKYKEVWDPVDMAQHLLDEIKKKQKESITK